MKNLKISKLFAFIGLLRLHQWFKNILIFVPIFTANILPDIKIIYTYSIGFIALSLCVSSVYIFNDILDYKNDKLHPLKCKRPIASGKISIRESIFLLIIILTIGLILSLNINKFFFLYILIYIVIANFYSVFFKKFFLLDCLILSFFYTFRIMIGGTIIGLQISEWLIIFSFTWFLSLALIKRYSELMLFKKNKKKKLLGRMYYLKDNFKVKFVGVISGYLSILTLAFYIYSDNASLYFTQPNMIWLLILILFIWINFMWINASNNEISEDPILYAFRNKISFSLGIIFIIFSVVAKWL